MMKKLFLITGFILIALIGYSQTGRPTGRLLTNFATQSADTIYIFDDIGRHTAYGGIFDVQIIYDSIDCKDSWIMLGSTNKVNSAPNFPASAGDISFPAVIDTTAVNAASQLKYRPVPYDDTWSFTAKWQWNSQQLVYVLYKGSCTKGTAYSWR